MYLIKEMPQSERPRERMIKYGPKSLSNEELLAILFRTGYHDLSVIDLARHVLYQLDSIEDLKSITFERLLKVKGIKTAKATTLLSAIELGYRLASYKREKRMKITSPFDVYHLLVHDIGHLDQENFVVLYVNIKSELIKQETLYVGTINQMMIHPREIFKKAIELSAAAMIFVHNHPSGDSEPSKADIKATEHLNQTAEVMGIDLIDHIVIGHHEFYSIKARQKTKI